MTLEAGRQAALTFTVSDDDTALALGSGDVPVLATPRLLAWLEAATCAAVAKALAPSDTTVGTGVELEHRAATPVGGQVTCRADLVAVDGRLLRFAVAAHDQDDRLVATGDVTRVRVDRERFLGRPA